MRVCRANEQVASSASSTDDFSSDEVDLTTMVALSDADDSGNVDHVHYEDCDVAVVPTNPSESYVSFPELCVGAPAHLHLATDESAVHCFRAAPGLQPSIKAQFSGTMACLQVSATSPRPKASKAAAKRPPLSQTTIVLRNLPLQCSRTMLLEVLITEGFAGRFDFVYVPCNFDTCLNLGSAFVNFVSPDQGELARRHFEGFNAWGVPCEKPCKTDWSDPYQGYAANVGRYRNSPVMHASVADELKPILFDAGVRKPFPAPSRMIKAPKARNRSAPLQVATDPSAALHFSLISL